MEKKNKLEMKLTLWLRTHSTPAVIMYTQGTDYGIMEIHNVRLQHKCDCGRPWNCVCLKHSSLMGCGMQCLLK